MTVDNRIHQNGRLREVLTILWALIPLFTLGLGTALLMIHPAVRLRDIRQTVATVVYVVLIVLMFSVDRDASGTQRALFDGALGFSMLVGTGHAFVIRSRVWNLNAPAGARRLQNRQRAALAAHADQHAARENARALAEQDPHRALELRIGRPDIADRTYPDGGLIDVNNVPAYVLASALNISPAMADQVVRSRGVVGGFSSVADLSVTMNLPPKHLDPVASTLVFLRPTAT